MGKEREKGVEPGLSDEIMGRGLAIRRLIGMRKMPRVGGDNAGRIRNFGIGVEDREISSYLQNNKEMHYKKMVWEMMNKNIEIELKRKQQQKQITKAEKAISKKEAKVESDLEIKQRKLSSKINFDALRKQMEEEQEAAKEAKSKDVLSDHGNQENVRRDEHKSNSDENYSGNEDSNKEEDQDYDQECEVSNHYNEDYNGGDYTFDNEQYDYTYSEDYDD